MQKALQIAILDDIGGWGFNLDTLLSQLKDFSGEEINVPINSYGGSVTDGIAIYNTLLGRKETINTSIVGYAMSMGSIIAMAGDTVTMPEQSYLMIHNPYGVSMGDADDMEGTSKVLAMMTDDLINIYRRKTKLPKSQIRAMMKAETWLSSARAKELGFVDKITKGATFEASFNPTQLQSYSNVPTEIKAQFKINNNMDILDKLNGVLAKFGLAKAENEDAAVAQLEQGFAANAEKEKAATAQMTAIEVRVAALETNDVTAKIEELETVVELVAETIEPINAAVIDLQAKHTESNKVIEAKVSKAETALNRLRSLPSAMQTKATETVIPANEQKTNEKEMPKAMSASEFIAQSN